MLMKSGIEYFSIAFTVPKLLWISYENHPSLFSFESENEMVCLFAINK
jgi:hypothetical protein